MTTRSNALAAHCRRGGSRHPRRGHPRGPCRLLRASSGASLMSASGRASQIYRRLRASSHRDRRGAAGCALAGNGRVIAVIQPHRYTRLQDLFNEFCRLPRRCRYSAGDAGLFGGRGADPRHRPRWCASGLRRARSSERARPSMARRGSPRPSPRSRSRANSWPWLGAGTITDWINALPKRLARSPERGHETTRRRVESGLDC